MEASASAPTTITAASRSRDDDRASRTGATASPASGAANTDTAATGSTRNSVKAERTSARWFIHSESTRGSA
ncbi:MAG: hypothetical protein ACJ8CH_21625, partial [Microvirga sp.]